MKCCESNHTFIICAYKESPYLEECIVSLKNQTVISNIALTTSTPNKYIMDICKRYKIPLYINDKKKGISDDWNFAYSKCSTDIITIAHQDDIYETKYTEELISKTNSCKDMLIYFTNYYELRENKIIKDSFLLLVKRIMLMPLKISFLSDLKFIKRLVISFGCPICCPSVTFKKSNLPSTIFRNDYKSDLDWQAWEYLSVFNGRFIYNSKPLIYHRIHEESETSNVINSNLRVKEDYEMFCRFWPKFIAKMLVLVYKNSEKSNKKI